MAQKCLIYWLKMFAHQICHILNYSIFMLIWSPSLKCVWWTQPWIRSLIVKYRLIDHKPLPPKRFNKKNSKENLYNSGKGFSCVAYTQCPRKKLGEAVLSTTFRNKLNTSKTPCNSPYYWALDFYRKKWLHRCKKGLLLMQRFFCNESPQFFVMQDQAAVVMGRTWQ